MAAGGSSGGSGRRGRSRATGKAIRSGKTVRSGKVSKGPRKKKGAAPSKHTKPGKAARPGKRANAKARTPRVSKKKATALEFDHPPPEFEGRGKANTTKKTSRSDGGQTQDRPATTPGKNPGKIARRRRQGPPTGNPATGNPATDEPATRLQNSLKQQAQAHRARQPEIAPDEQRYTEQEIAAAPCPHFGPCGGCSQLHRPYEDEARDKEEALRSGTRDALGLKQVRVDPILAAEEPLYYRAALKVPFATTPEGPVCGFYQRGTHRIVDLTTCLIQVPALTELIQATRELVARCQVPIYHEHLHRGVLRHLVARIAPGTDEILAGLVVRRAGAPQIKKLAWQLHDRFRDRGLVGVIENVNPDQTNAILGPRSNRLVGRSVMFEEIDGLRFRTSLESFSQVNPAQASRLFAEVVKLLDPISEKHVVDLYAGYGPIGLRLAKNGARVTAIERNRIAARDGIAIARANGLEDQIRFITADAATGLDAVEGSPDALVVDPPRRGLGTEVMELLCARRIPRIIYVSCNPETLIPNLERLAPVYRTESIRPVDLFPRTDHVEAVASLVLREDV